MELTLEALCEGIGLQNEVRETVLAFAETFDFETVRPQLEGLKTRDGETAARRELAERLGDDPGELKLLACMLQCAAEAYAWYEERGSDDRIYWDTMKYFPRFVGECRRDTGAWAFDRAFWTVRQVGCRLFRLGALEFEVEERGDAPALWIHIPSDAILTPAACDNSFKQAEGFFAQHFGMTAPEYVCHSWLLSPALRQILPQDSNIARFQSRFYVLETDQTDRSFLQWVFHRTEEPWETLPEETSLQWALKTHLLAGGIIGAAEGVLSHRTFGAPIPGAHYNRRVGAYGICFDGKGNVALVKAPAAHGPERWCFLPGGGIETGETDKDCLRRECLEELGRLAEVGEYLCTGDEYVYAEHAGDYVHVTGRCFRMELGEQVQAPVEHDHSFRWVPVEDCGKEMFLKYQAWAVRHAWAREQGSAETPT